MKKEAMNRVFVFLMVFLGIALFSQYASAGIFGENPFRTLTNSSFNLSVISGEHFVNDSGDNVTGPIDMNSNPIVGVSGLNATEIHIGNIMLSNRSDNGLWDGAFIIRTNVSDDVTYGGVFLIDNINNVPYAIFKPVRPERASVITGSLIVSSLNISLMNSTNSTLCQAHADIGGFDLKIDCNSTSPSFNGTGADVLIEGDVQVNEELWAKDTDNEFHFLSRELQVRDEMFRNLTLVGINAARDGTNVTVQTVTGETFVVNIDKTEGILNRSQESITITFGTNETPTLNQIFFQDKDNPQLSTSTILQTNVASVATFLMGDDFEYASVAGLIAGNDIIRKIYLRALDSGTIYKSGFLINVTPSEINITTGRMKVFLDDLDISSNHSTSEKVVEIRNNGSFRQHINDLDGFDEYGTGEPISTNKFFNLVCGIVNTHDLVGNMHCVVQNKPGTEHATVEKAENDNIFINFFPSVFIVKVLYIPIVRVIVQNTPGGNVIQTLSNDNLFFDLRGRIGGGGGSPPMSGVTEHSELGGLESDDHDQYLLNNETNSSLIYDSTAKILYVNQSDLNTSLLVQGTLADARLSSNVCLLDTTQTFTAEKTFSSGLVSTGINVSDHLDVTSGNVTVVAGDIIINQSQRICFGNCSIRIVFNGTCLLMIGPTSRSEIC